MTPRQPSVPNLIGVIVAEYTRRVCDQHSQIGLLEQALTMLFFEPFNDFGHVLSAVSRTNKKRIWRLNHDEIADPNPSQQFIRGPPKIAFCIEREAICREDVF